ELSDARRRKPCQRALHLPTRRPARSRGMARNPAHPGAVVEPIRAAQTCPPDGRGRPPQPFHSCGRGGPCPPCQIRLLNPAKSTLQPCQHVGRQKAEQRRKKNRGKRVYIPGFGFAGFEEGLAKEG